MRINLLALLIGCSGGAEGDDAPIDASLPDAATTACTDSFPAAVMAPAHGSMSPPETNVKVTFSSTVSNRYVIVRDIDDNRFTTASDISGTIIDATYSLPAGRTITVEVGYVCQLDNRRRPLAQSTFTITSPNACDTQTLGYAAAIHSPAQDVVLPPIVTPSSTFDVSWSPTMGIPDRYERMYDETAGHEALSSVPGYELQPNHRYTFEVGWYCVGVEPTERAIPMAALSFTTSN
ncbi:MAG: hypothetical protein H0T42_27285 [Deltaproteobacteria bacterium]|nr:hypothetical protein [Deltaproteobacteria bacterium]